MLSTVLTTRAGSRVEPFRETRLEPALRIPRWLALAIGGALALGPVLAGARRGEPGRVRALRAILISSAAAYAVNFVLDSAEHFRLEKAATGHYLRWIAVPLGESALHLAVLVDLLTAMATARRPRRRMRGREVGMLLAPALFLAVGWLDELAYHRRRVPLREELIHATEHIAEGTMWTTLYALRVLTRR